MLTWIWSILAAGLLASNTVEAETGPELFGYGVKGCDEYVLTWAARERGEAEAEAEYLMYRSWLAGFVSGLSLATGENVLRGSDLESAMQRNRAHCRGNPDQDFFNASMDLIRMLSKLR
jgi:hypothetical protein